MLAALKDLSGGRGNDARERLRLQKYSRYFPRGSATMRGNFLDFYPSFVEPIELAPDISERFAVPLKPHLAWNMQFDAHSMP